MSDTNSTPTYRLNVTDQTQDAHMSPPIQEFDSVDAALNAAATYPLGHAATIHEADSAGRPVKWYRVNMQTGRIAQSGNIPAHGEEDV